MALNGCTHLQHRSMIVIMPLHDLYNGTYAYVMLHNYPDYIILRLLSFHYRLKYNKLEQ